MRSWRMGLSRICGLLILMCPARELAKYSGWSSLLSAPRSRCDISKGLAPRREDLQGVRDDHRGEHREGS